MQKSLLSLSALTLVLSGCASLDSPGLEPAGTNRPTIANTTQTVGDGMMSFELGVQTDPDDTFHAPLLLRYGAGPRTEIFIGGDGYRSIDQGGVDDSGVGDAVIGFRHRLRDEDEFEPGVAFEFAAKIPVADDDEGLGTGQNDTFASIIADRDFFKIDWTGYYRIGLLGRQDGSDADLEHTFTVSGRKHLKNRFDKLTVYSELAYMYTPEQDLDEVTHGLGVFYEIKPALLLDIGWRTGLTDDAQDFQLVFGLTRSLGRLALRRDLAGY